MTIETPLSEFTSMRTEQRCFECILKCSRRLGRDCYDCHVQDYQYN